MTHIKVMIFIILFTPVCSFSQITNDSISREQVDSIITYLASDKLKGRANFTKEQLEAAVFINQKFTEYKLKPFPGYKTFYQPFLTHYKIPLPDTIPISIFKILQDTLLFNLVAVLPGHSKPNEAIIFSAHYDHVKSETGEIYNGANDDASGTTAVLALARYFSMRSDNARTIIFCLFAGEELGLRGSYAFEKLVEPESIKAVINIEMIGATNRTGNRAFFVTGSNHSDLASILRRNSKHQKVQVIADAADLTGLFSRSDNYPFALEGIPAHSIMCSDDFDECYHQPCDDVDRLNISNMVEIIKAIALYSSTLISGQDTPRRIK